MLRVLRPHVWRRHLCRLSGSRASQCAAPGRRLSAAAMEAAVQGAVDTPPDAAPAATHASLPLSANGRVALLGVTQHRLQDWLVTSLGERPSRAEQLFAELYRKAAAGGDVSAMTALSADFRHRVAALVDTSGDVTLAGVVPAADGTRKLLFTLAGGGTVEAVLIPARNGSRTTLCVSSQLGCAMNCQFCATARMGLRRNLSAAQMVAQVLVAKRLLLSEAGVTDDTPRNHSNTHPIGNIVWMGMGEPLHNVDEVMTALEVVLDPAGLAFSHNRVTVSTSGLVPAIRRFVTHSKASLAVSLNATTDEVRSWIMPVNRKHNLEELLGTLRELFGPESPISHRRRDVVFLEYVLLAGVNDTDADAQRLVAIAQSLPCKVNLITFNPHDGTPFKPAAQEVLLRFRHVLASAGVVVTIRESRGDDSMAACGQLGKPEEQELWKPQPPRTKPPVGLR